MEFWTNFPLNLGHLLKEESLKIEDDISFKQNKFTSENFYIDVILTSLLYFILYI